METVPVWTLPTRPRPEWSPLADEWRSRGGLRRGGDLSPSREGTTTLCRRYRGTRGGGEPNGPDARDHHHHRQLTVVGAGAPRGRVRGCDDGRVRG